MSSVLKAMSQAYLKGVLDILADDEVIKISLGHSKIVLLIMFLQRMSLFFSSWGINEEKYKDEKIDYISQYVGWFTLSTLVQILNSFLFNQMALYILFCYHISSLVTQGLLLIANKWLSSTVRQTLSKFLYIYFSLFSYIFLFPSILYSSRYIICQRQNHILNETENCSQSNYISSGMALQIILLYQCLIYTYLYRNISLPVSNYLKRRFSPLSLICLLTEFPCILLQQYITYPFYIVGSCCRLIMSLLYLFDSWCNRPLHCTLNKVFLLAISIIMVFESILFLISGFINIHEDSLVYYSLVLSPLLVQAARAIFYHLPPKNTEQDVLYWVDELHVFESEMKKDAGYQIRWIKSILKHRKACSEITCISHLEIDPSNDKLVKQQTNGVVICLLSSVVSAKTNKIKNKKKAMENINLHFISYLAFECQSPLKGYIQLKIHMLSHEDPTLFFKLISEYLIEKFKSRTNHHQAIKFQHLIRENYLEKLNIDDITASEDLNSQLMPFIIRTVNEKITMWTHLMKGFPRMEDFLSQVTGLSKRILEVKSIAFKRHQIDQMNISKSVQNLNGIDLKTLSIVYSVVLNDYYGTMDIENRLNEILKYERNLQIEVILNSSLIQEQVVVFITSILKNRGKIVNSNRGQLARFFEYSGEREFDKVLSVDQLIPKFIAKTHDEMIGNYIQIGYSKFFSAQQHVFYLDNMGFIHSGNIRLTNIFNNSDDYLVAASLLKTKKNTDFLMFDTNGRILGISQALFNQFTNESSITLPIMLKKGYIYFWIHQIHELLKQDLSELTEETNYQTSIKTLSLHLLKNVDQLYSNFENSHRRTSSRARFDRSKSNINLILLESKKTIQLNADNYSATENNPNIQTDIDSTDITLQGISIPLLSQYLKGKLDQFFSNQYKQVSSEVSQKIHLRYSLEFKVLGGQSLFGYFIMNVHEFQYRGNNDQSSQFTQKHLASTISQNSPDPQKSQVFSEDDPDLLSLEIGASRIAYDQFQKKTLLEVDMAFKTKTEVINPYQNQEDVQKEPVVSQLITPRIENKMNLLQEDAEEVVDDNLHRASSKSHSKHDVVQIIRKKVHDNQPLETRQNNSISSGNTSVLQNSGFNLIKKLQNRTSIPRSLIFIQLINCLACVVLIVFVIGKIQLIEENLNTLQEQLILIESPNQFNQIYCTFAVYTQMYYLYIDNGFQLNDYEFKRLQEGSKLMLTKLGPLANQARDQFASSQENGLLEPVKIYRLQGNGFIEENLTIFEFLVYFNQDSFQQNKLIQVEVPITLRLLASSYTLKLNILAEIKLARNLLDALSNTFFEALDSNRVINLILLGLEVWIVALIIPMQIPLWKGHYRYHQQILLLISRATLSEVQQIVLKNLNIKDLLIEGSGTWKNTDFHQMMFSTNKEKFVDVISKNKNEKNGIKAVNSTLTSRIQELGFEHRILYLVTILTTLLLQLLIYGMYQYSKTLSDTTRPQLELSMSFIQLKQNYDSVNSLAFLIKSEPLISGFTQQVFSRVVGLENMSKQMEREQISLLNQINSNLYSSFEIIYDQIVNSQKISSSNSQILLDLYSSDLCLLLPEKLPFCRLKKNKFIDFPDYPEPEARDNYRSQIRYGMTGLVEAFRTIIQQAYHLETTSLKYDTNTERITQFLYSMDFTTTIMSYYTDLFQPFEMFQKTISQAAIDILQQDVIDNTLLYYILCMCMVVFIQAISVWSIYLGLERIKIIRQALVMLPYSMLFDPQTVNQLKRLDKD